ncbi:hypothetical protein Efla_000138 [Eimeria flavescens]
MWDSIARLIFPTQHKSPPQPQKRPARLICFPKSRWKGQIEESIATQQGRLTEYDEVRVRFGQPEDESNKWKQEMESLRMEAHDKSLFETALAIEREETARLRAIFSGLRGAQESLQAEHVVTNQPRSGVDGVQENLRHLEAIKRRGMSDRVTVHKLEKQPIDGKTVMKVLSAEVDRLRNKQFATTDQCPTNNSPIQQPSSSVGSHNVKATM